MKNYLKSYVRLGDDTEMPGLFMLWCGLSTLSCVLGRKVWVDMGQYIIYPNLYVILVAGSGKCRKSTSISIAERLLRRVEPPLNIIAQKITPEALIEALRIVHTDDEHALLRETCDGFVLTDELSTFLDKRSYELGLGSLLITLFDCKETFEYRTRSRGAEVLTNVCLGMLSASTLDWIRQAIPLAAVGEGLTSRICFVYIDKPPPPVAMTIMTDMKRLIFEELSDRLQEVARLQGRITMTPSAEELYVEIYDDFYSGSTFYNDALMSGYASRRHVHLLKLATLFSVAETDTLFIDKNHITYANNLLKDTEEFMPKVIRFVASSDQGLLSQLILNRISQGGKIAREDLLRSFSHRVGTRDLNEHIETLIHTGQIESQVAGGRIYYRLSKR